MFFYIFSVLMIIGALMVISSSNPVHSVLWLIFSFINASGLMVIIGAEFIAMILIVLYVGAIAVFFLFVIMTLDIKIAESRGALTKESIFSYIMGGLLFVNLALVVSFGVKYIEQETDVYFTIPDDVTNTEAIARFLYTDFIIAFQTCGAILFVAMIASIFLTLRKRNNIKKQSVKEQLLRNKDNAIAVAKNDGKNGLDNLNYDD